MKPTYVFTMIVCVLISCNSIKSLTVKEGAFPFIGTIGQEKISIPKTHFVEMGHPILERQIRLNAQILPFTSSSFKSYSHAKEQQGYKSTLRFVDSLEPKPRYVKFDISDRIGLKEALNNGSNKSAKSYLENDEANKLVNSISVVLDPTTNAMISDADGVFLITDNTGLLWIEMIKNSVKHRLKIPNDQIFDYGVMGVCWVENNYGQTRVETFSDTGRCPEGSVRNVKKLHSSPSFLKL